MFWTLDEFASQGRTSTGGCVVIFASPRAVSRETWRTAFARCGVTVARAGVMSGETSAKDSGLSWDFGRSGGGGDCVCEPPRANTCSSDAVPPLEDVGVPPAVIAMYSLPFTE